MFVASAASSWAYESVFEPFREYQGIVVLAVVKKSVLIMTFFMLCVLSFSFSINIVFEIRKKN